MNNINSERYLKQIMLPEIGMAGQLKLNAAKVLVIGAGGLGCPVLQYLCAAGVGTIGIVDFDVVEIGNLHRQILYAVADIGSNKSIIAKQRLLALNPEINIQCYESKLEYSNALDIISNYQIIVDCSDSIPTRYVVNDACVILDKIMVYGALYKFEGQVAVFNYESGPTYRCLFPEKKYSSHEFTCDEAGTLGVLPGIIGTLQANEVLKIILQLPSPVSNGILLFNAHTSQTSFVGLKRNDAEIKKTLASKNKFSKSTGNSSCSNSVTDRKFKELSISELVSKLISGFQPQFVDVREEYETPSFEEINALKIPLHDISDNIDLIDPERPVVVLCQTGARSNIAAQLICKSLINSEIFTLHGGMNEIKNKTISNSGVLQGVSN